MNASVSAPFYANSFQQSADPYDDLRYYAMSPGPNQQVWSPHAEQQPRSPEMKGCGGRSPLPYVVPTYITWKNFRRQYLQVCVIYPFVHAHFPGLGAMDESETNRREQVEKSIRSVLHGHFKKFEGEEAYSPNSKLANPQKWVFMGEKMAELEAKLQQCLPGGELHEAIVEKLANPALLQQLLDGSWGARRPDGSLLPTSKEEIESMKKETTRRNHEERQARVAERKRTRRDPAMSMQPYGAPPFFGFMSPQPRFVMRYEDALRGQVRMLGHPFLPGQPRFIPTQPMVDPRTIVHQGHGSIVPQTMHFHGGEVVDVRRSVGRSHGGPQRERHPSGYADERTVIENEGWQIPGGGSQKKIRESPPEHSEGISVDNFDGLRSSSGDNTDDAVKMFTETIVDEIMKIENPSGIPEEDYW